HRPDATEEQHDQDRDQVLHADYLVIEAQSEEAADASVFVGLADRRDRPAEEPLEGIIEKADAHQEGPGGEEVPEDDAGVLIVNQTELVAEPDAKKIGGDREQHTGDGVIWNRQSSLGYLRSHHAQLPFSIGSGK